MLLRACLSAALAALVLTPVQGAPGRWYKGHTHCHSTNSDGSLAPEQVALWYRDHGYNFLAITDHHRLTDPVSLRHVETASFILLPGTELSATPLDKQTHTCGINIDKEIPSRSGSTPASTLQKMANDIRAAGGLVQVNHPNWLWGLTADDIRPVRGALLLEVYNMGSGCNNEGDPALGKPSVEAVWDDLLTSGKTVWGVCSDDAHTYVRGDPDGPGKGWIVVRAEALTPANIVRAIDKGEFYASTGVELESVDRAERELSLRIRAEAGKTYVTRFVGLAGRTLAECAGESPSFAITGTEGYVRARVAASDGAIALTQPIFVRQAR